VKGGSDVGFSLLRLLVVVVGGWAGSVVGMAQDGVVAGGIGAGVGVVCAVGLCLLERSLRAIPVRAYLHGLGGLLAGLLLGLVLTHLMEYVLLPTVIQNPGILRALSLLIYVSCAYLGVVVGLSKGPELGGQESGTEWLREGYGSTPKILDTSVIIDGRIADICETGFLEGPLIVPQFVLKELQHIAGSSDTLKRNRGRRGLDILQRIQKNFDRDVRIVDHDFPKIRDVDTKLVALGKTLKGKVLTNDFNLNKVAELQGVPVLNINQLANAVKPVVLPGEVMNVYVLKEGKEYGQGVAYLDDGTMVVIDNARKYLSQHVDVSVTSVLQTTAGRMIFSRLKEDAVPVESR
jgi:uncharacterized protein YacL